MRPVVAASLTPLIAVRCPPVRAPHPANPAGDCSPSRPPTTNNCCGPVSLQRTVKHAHASYRFHVCGSSIFRLSSADHSPHTLCVLLFCLAHGRPLPIIKLCI